jgi:hypothetical protein
MDYFSLTDFLDPNPLRGMNRIYPSDRRKRPGVSPVTRRKFIVR